MFLAGLVAENFTRMVVSGLKERVWVSFLLASAAQIFHFLVHSKSTAQILSPPLKIT